ncbi:metallophosphoesterase [Aquipuribacter nitratireducens]|uniref:Metallophosphoesterase n=1 Tax=Aquipuribacter nitratireducens TaxID=650104 RepID=A0ABW0GP33_9MICO
MSRRRGAGRAGRWTAGVAGVLAVLLVLLAGYGVLVEPRLVLDERRLEVALPGAAADADPVRAVFLSDLQVGMWWANTGMVERAAQRGADVDPDLVLLGGDYLYSRVPDPAVQARTVVDLLEPLLALDVPVVAVLGNHDHASGGAEEVTAALEDAGVRVLENDSTRVASAGLHVVGLGTVRQDLVDVDAALDDVPTAAPRVVLSHNPTAFPRLPAGSAPLTLAGHTHCGQVALPGTPRWSYLGLTEEEALVADGWAPAGYGTDGNRLFVSCGIGFSAYPVRVNAPPQLVVVDLVPDAGTAAPRNFPADSRILVP